MEPRKRKASYHIFLWIAIPLILYISYVQINRSEVNDIHFVEVLCIDQQDDTYTITALYDNAGSKNNDGLQSIEGTGDSVYTAYTDMSRKNSKDISLDHADYFLISENTAKKGLPDCLDFISREPDLKTNANIFIVQSDNTNKLLKDAMEEDFTPSETLNAISQKETNNLKKPNNTLLQVLNSMDHSYNNLLIPYLVYDNNTMYLEGYSTFKNQKLYGFLDYNTSLAVDFFRNNLRTYPLELSRNLNVELSNINVTPHVSLKNDSLFLKLIVKSDSQIKEASDAIDIFNPDTLSKMNDLEKYRLIEQLSKIIRISKRYHLDLLNIGSTLEKQTQSTKLKKNWETYIENLDISLSVQSATAKTYTIDTDKQKKTNLS
ncbi:Ger(x)C family spore germination protein [[Clostridium] polysaccharolyticum]|uniref:Germination protein, Ger(X)C family n=1 Tax=[Clostridium] polysaccharolyticum TaxID=29364 RepID=A0A1I0DE74_9FIRM|nr:Ger(x)C family spore germination C-terminal domain-containing protein [[Clostridium] polysaccharolyticum]SET30319.1 germination protein, Ger(x)C family [[Clostridium] polysaccharolyticum]